MRDAVGVVACFSVALLALVVGLVSLLLLVGRMKLEFKRTHDVDPNLFILSFSLLFFLLSLSLSSISTSTITLLIIILINFLLLRPPLLLCLLLLLLPLLLLLSLLSVKP